MKLCEILSLEHRILTIRNSTLRLRSLQNITQGLNTSRMATDLVPLEANLGRSEWCHRDIVETHGIYTSYQQLFSHTRKLRHHSWHALFLRLKALVMLLPPQTSHGRSDRAIKLHIGSKACWDGKTHGKPVPQAWPQTMSKYNQPISTFRRAWIAGARVSGCRTWTYCWIFRNL